MDSNEENNHVRFIKSEFENVNLEIEMDNPIEKIDQFIKVNLDIVDDLKQNRIQIVNYNMLNNQFFQIKPLVYDMDIYRLIETSDLFDTPEENDEPKLVYIHDPKEIKIEILDNSQKKSQRKKNWIDISKKYRLLEKQKKKALFESLSKEAKINAHLRMEYNTMQSKINKLFKILNNCKICKTQII